MPNPLLTGPLRGVALPGRPVAPVRVNVDLNRLVARWAQRTLALAPEADRLRARDALLRHNVVLGSNAPAANLLARLNDSLRPA